MQARLSVTVGRKLNNYELLTGLSFLHENVSLDLGFSEHNKEPGQVCKCKQTLQSSGKTWSWPPEQYVICQFTQKDLSVQLMFGL